MSVTVSDVRKGAHSSTEWHIRNWASGFELLKDYACCYLEVQETAPTGVTPPPPLKFRFFFRPHEEKNTNGYVTSTWLSLNVELVSGRRPPIVIIVDLLTNTTSPPKIPHLRCSINKDEEGLATTIIQKKFIHLARNNYNAFGQLITTDEFPKVAEYRFYITVTVFNFNVCKALNEDNNDSNDDNNKGASSVEESVAEVSLTKDLRYMYGAEDNFSDLKLETKDNMLLSAHRFILAARSPVFRTMIEDNVKEDGFSGTIKVPTVNGKPMTVVLHWMYTGELHENSYKCMEQLVEICTEFRIPDLLGILDKKLIDVCTTQNMFQLFQLAKKHGMETAKGAISDFIKENITKA